MAKRDSDFVYVMYIKTTPEKLWDALTNPEFTRQYWFGIEVNSDWKVGSIVKYNLEGKVMVDGKVLVADRPRTLSYTFHEAFGESAVEPPTRVVLEITPEPDSDVVKITVTHSDFVENSLHKPSISIGWPVVLSGLKTMLETGKILQIQI